MAKVAEKNNTKNFMDEYSGEGTQFVTADDLAIPFLKISQALSDEIDAESPEFIKGLKLGMFFNSLTKYTYGKEISIIPLRFQKVWLEWKPKRGGLVNRHEPGTIEVDKTDFSEWKRPNGNVIQETHMFYCMIEEHLEDGPILFAMQSTGIKHAKNWNSQILMTRLPNGNQAPYFSSVWTLSIDKYTNDQGTYYQIGGKTSNIERVRFIKKSEFSDYILPTYENVKRLESNVNFAKLEDKSNSEDSEVAY